jgi:hypothetical protein
MSEVARQQLLVTLVHGTWPRGFFPALRRRRRRLWFEEGSPFLAQLRAEFNGVAHKIKPLLWTGENSIYARDKVAHALAEDLLAEHAENPQVAQLIIAHSHGGNIALRAFHHMQTRDCSQRGADAANPFVVTLASPFIEIHEADFGPRPLFIRIALMVALWIVSIFSAEGLLLLVSVFLLPPMPKVYFSVILLIVLTVTSLSIVLLGWWWIVRKAGARGNQVNALKDATRLRGLTFAQRLLVIRAIDDEASLVLALGAIFNYVTARFITYTLFLYFVLPPIILFSTNSKWAPWLPIWAYAATFPVFIAVTVALLGALMLSRSVHGRELAVSPMECQINTQSVPDAINLSQIVTLVSRNYVKSLHHGIYQHENCAKAIADWLRPQLGA